jgi:hypothetical protein
MEDGQMGVVLVEVVLSCLVVQVVLSSLAVVLSFLVGAVQVVLGIVEVVLLVQRVVVGPLDP